MLGAGRTALTRQWGMVARQGQVMYASSNVPTIPSSSGEIALPMDKGIFKPCPTSEDIPQEIKDKWYPQIGNRSIVGDSYSANHDYFDAPDIPVPAIRFAENTPEVLALREKEKGDWTKLTLDEKKQLYRNSFRQTLAEAQAPTGDWKRFASGTIYLFAFALLYQILMARKFRPDPEPYQKAVDEDVVFHIIGGANPVTGKARNYDYENNQWKK